MGVKSVRFNADEEKALNVLTQTLRMDTSAVIKRHFGIYTKKCRIAAIAARTSLTMNELLIRFLLSFDNRRHVPECVVY
jgi:hypothetical protein